MKEQMWELGPVVNVALIHEIALHLVRASYVRILDLLAIGEPQQARTLSCWTTVMSQWPFALLRMFAITNLAVFDKSWGSNRKSRCMVSSPLLTHSLLLCISHIFARPVRSIHHQRCLRREIPRHMEGIPKWSEILQTEGRFQRRLYLRITIVCIAIASTLLWTKWVELLLKLLTKASRK